MAGRKYWFVDMRRGGKDEGAQMRVAKNMPVQGTNADVIKLAMGRMVARFRKEQLDAFLVNMVHDEVVVECAGTQAEEAREVVAQEMVRAGDEFIHSVPMAVDTKISDAWSK